MKKRKLIIIVLSFIALAAILLALPPTRSYMVMSVYSAIENRQSVMSENDFKIDVPSEKGWYPFVITFNTANFGKWSDTGADMSIMYNFAAFNLDTLSSGIFDAKDEKHSSFYGAYALSQEDGYFGYTAGKVDLDEIVLTFKYDYKFLVLKDLGCTYPDFEVTDSKITEDVTFLDMDGWTRIDAVMETNAMLHTYKENHTSYIQYGKPVDWALDDFPLITMYGRLYIKIFEEYDSTVIVYAMSPFETTIEQCDAKLLQNVEIKPID